MPLQVNLDQAVERRQPHGMSRRRQPANPARQPAFLPRLIEPVQPVVDLPTTIQAVQRLRFSSGHVNTLLWRCPGSPAFLTNQQTLSCRARAEGTRDLLLGYAISAEEA